MPPAEDNQFIPKREESGVNALFEELGSELDYGDIAKQKNEISDGKKHPLEWTVLGLGIVFKILIVGTFVSAADVSIRNQNSSDIIKSLPLCSYYSMGVDNFDNIDCRTYTEIDSSLKGTRAALEEELGIGLAKLVPQKLLVQNALKSQEVQYILAKTSTNRVSINEMLNKFADLRTTATEYEGQDIECSGYAVNEK